MISKNSIILTASQQRAMAQMQAFVHDSSVRCFVLTGYAGTGKTTLMHTLIQYLKQQNLTYCLLSSTGRAAKILSNYTGEKAGTVHHLIYSYKGFNKDLSDAKDDLTADEVGQLYLNFELSTHNSEEDDSIIYIVDEASMLGDCATQIIQALFGSGRLLKDLFDHDLRPKSKFIFVGDPCQLPPISSSISPALSPDYLQHTFGYATQHVMLTEIMRQKGDSSIIQAANSIRKLWTNAPETEDYYRVKVWGKLPITQYADIHFLPTVEDMINLQVHLINEYGYNESTFICQSNKDCSRISHEIRNRLGRMGGIQPHDLLMVTQNQLTTGLMNGDMVEVVSVNPKHERVMVDTKQHYRTELYFVEITVRELVTGREYTTLILENLLDIVQANLDARQQTGLFLDFIMRMKSQGITQKKDKLVFDTALRNDPYLNALRCSYGYAITCHKAQGGEWNSVFIYPMRNIMLNPIKANYQWIYTAVTRAKNNVYLCNDFYYC